MCCSGRSVHSLSTASSYYSCWPGRPWSRGAAVSRRPCANLSDEHPERGVTPSRMWTAAVSPCELTHLASARPSQRCCGRSIGEAAVCRLCTSLNASCPARHMKTKMEGRNRTAFKPIVVLRALNLDPVAYDRLCEIDSVLLFHRSCPHRVPPSDPRIITVTPTYQECVLVSGNLFGYSGFKLRTYGVSTFLMANNRSLSAASFPVG